MHATRPARNAATNPEISTSELELSVPNSPEKMSFAIFPKIKGTTIRKENRAAFALSLCNKTDVEIVAPEREIPGSMAIAWAMPIIIASLNETSLSVFLALSARNNNTAVTKSIKPTNNRFPPKSEANWSSDLRYFIKS